MPFPAKPPGLPAEGCANLALPRVDNPAVTIALNRRAVLPKDVRGILTDDGLASRVERKERAGLLGNRVAPWVGASFARFIRGVFVFER